MTDDPFFAQPDAGSDIYSHTSVLDDGTELVQFSHDPASGVVDALVTNLPDGSTVVQVNPEQPGTQAFVYDGGELVAVGRDLDDNGLLTIDEFTSPDSAVVADDGRFATTPDVEEPVSVFVQRGGDEVAEDISHGFEQSTGYTCAPSAVTMVVADFFDIEVGSEIEAGLWAAENGLLSEQGGGMYQDGIVALLEHFGVPAHVETGSMGSLDAYLEEGRAVILAVDASEYWNLPDVPDSTGHAVRVVDIDIERGIAVLTDSGVPDGAGLQVPLADLEKAWADMNHAMVVTDAVEFDAPGHDTAMIATGDGSAADAAVAPAAETGMPSGATNDTRMQLGPDHLEPLDLPVHPRSAFPGLVFIPGILSLAGWAAVRAAGRSKNS